VCWIFLNLFFWHPQVSWAPFTRAVHCTGRYALCTVHCTVHCALYCALCTAHWAVCTALCLCCALCRVSAIPGHVRTCLELSRTEADITAVPAHPSFFELKQIILYFYTNPWNSQVVNTFPKFSVHLKIYYFLKPILIKSLQQFPAM